MKKNKKFEFLDIDIKEKIRLKPFEIIHYYDLRLYFGIMTKGKLLLVYENDSGKRVPLKVFSKKGMILGGYSYFLEEEVTENFYYFAVEETEIQKISPEKSKELLLDRDFLFQCLKDTTKDSFSLIQELTYRLDNDVEKFLAYIFLNYSEDGQLRIKNFSFFSEFIKCSRSSFYAALGRLIDRGIIKKDGRVIIVVDWEKLKILAKI